MKFYFEIGTATIFNSHFSEKLDEMKKTTEKMEEMMTQMMTMLKKQQQMQMIPMQGICCNVKKKTPFLK